MSEIVRPPTSVSSDDERYKQLIKYRILEEAYKKDFAANRPNTSNSQTSNIISLTDIQALYPASGNIEEFRSETRGMSMKDDPLIQFVGNIEEDTIRITDTGRNYYEENQKKDIFDLKL